MEILQGLKNTISVDKELSNYYFKLNNYDLSIEYCKKILETTVNIQSIIENDKILYENNEIELKNIIEEAQEELIKLHFYYAENSFNNNQFEKAINLYKYVLTSNIDSHLVFYKIALCFKKLGQIDSAILFFNKSVSSDEKNFNSYKELGEIYYNQKNDFYNSIINYENYTLYDKNNSLVYNMLGFLYNRTGEIEKSFENLKKANEINSESELIISNLLFTLQKIPNKNQEDIYHLSKNTINKYLETKFVEEYKHEKRIKTNSNKIHIAYISGDFHDHVIMLYLLPILENHDKEKFIVTCYSNTSEENEDIYSIKAEMNSNNFKNISRLNNIEVSKLIYDDKVDILIDLSGHTDKTRIFCSLYKPAPIIVSYMGFPNTTGIENVDYFLSNKNLNDLEDNKYFTEKIYFLDSCYRCFKPSIQDSPDIKDIPYLKNNYITFGVFNDLSKINDSVIETWSIILKKVPNSKLYICRTTIIEEFLINKFNEFDIEQDRLIFDKRFSLEKYNEIDIHLDTFPYSGVTVIFDSLIMGVPTLTLKGEIFAGREAYNINLHLGLNDFISFSIEDYISKAISISKSIDKLKELKSNLRELYKKSVFCDYNNFTKSIEKAYIDMFNKSQIDNNS